MSSFFLPFKERNKVAVCFSRAMSSNFSAKRTLVTDKQVALSADLGSVMGGTLAQSKQSHDLFQ